MKFIADAIMVPALIIVIEGVAHVPIEMRNAAFLIFSAACFALAYAHLDLRRFRGGLDGRET